MATRFSAPSESYIRTVSLGVQANYSFSLWVKLSADRETYSTAISFGVETSAEGDVFAMLQTNNTGTAMEFITSGTFNATSLVNMTVGVWYYFGISMSGTTGTAVYRTDASPTFTTVAITNKAAIDQQAIHIGQSEYSGEYLNGCVTGVKWYSRTLTEAELKAEADFLAPVSTVDLRANYLLVTPSTTDDSGNGLTLTGGSGTTEEAGPSGIPESGSSETVGAVSLSASSTLAVSAVVEEDVTTSVLLPGTGALTTSARVDAYAAVSLTATGTVTAVPEVPQVFGAASATGTGLLAIAAEVHVKAAVTLPASSAFTVGGHVLAPPIVDPPKFPWTTVEIQFVDDVWTDVTPYFRGGKVVRGSTTVDSPVLRYETGTAEVRLDNRDRRFDPTNLAGPYVENFATDTGEQTFTASETFVFGHGVSLGFKSASGQAASIINVTSKASGTTGSYTCAKPDGTVSGKVMFAVASCDFGTLAPMDVTGGTSWGTPILELTSGENTLHTKVWRKVAGGSEPTNYTFSQHSGADGICAVGVLDGADTAVLPVIDSLINAERKLITAPGVALFGTNDLDVRWCAGNGSGASGVSWQSPADVGYTEYADKQSDSFTSGVLAARPLTSFGGTGTATRVIPMRPIRIQANWSFEYPTTNLVENPSFEESLSHWSAFTADTTLALSNAHSYAGGSSLRISREEENSPSFVYGAVLAGTGIAAGTSGGQTVTFSAYVYLPSASFPKVQDITVVLGGTTGSVVNDVPAADGWYRIQRTFVLSGAVSSVEIQFDTDNTHGDGQVVGYIDAVQLEVQSLATKYVDGSKPGYEWSGTAHDSSSTRPADVTFPVFNGFIDDWLIDWEGDYESEVTVPCLDGMALLADADRIALNTPVGANELTGARANRILDSVGWPVDKRSIDTGNTQVQETTMAGDALTELFLVSDTEIGEFYQDAAGNMVFRERRALMNDTRSIQSQVRFGDGGDSAGETPYHNVGITYESTQFVNEVRIARTGGTQQVVEDETSKLKYKRTRVHERTDLLMTSDGEALAHASWILYISKDPELRFNEMMIRPQKDEEMLFPEVLAREIGDRITVRRRPPGSDGDLIEREAFVRGIEHTIDQWFWETKYSLQSASKVGNFLTLNHPELGKIGTNALVY